MKRIRTKSHQPAFTLVELLVVIGIIALLISILLPALNKARKAAATVVCASQVRQIAMLVNLYATQNNGAIPGNAWTSSAFLFRPGAVYTESNCPQICQDWDWMSPIAKIAGYTFDENASITDRTARYQFLCNLPLFHCPLQDATMDAYGTSPIQVTVAMSSYIFPSIFQYQYKAGANAATDPKYQDFFIDPGYTPRINKVGSASQKICVAEGAKFSNSDTAVPDYNLAYLGGGTPGGQFADWGPFDQNTRAYLATHPRMFALRHGNTNPKAPLAEIKINLAFFDSHVETLSLREAMNPALWMPTGTTFNASTEMTPEAQALYYTGQSTITVP